MNWQAIFEFWAFVILLVILYLVFFIKWSIEVDDASKKWLWLYAVLFLIALISGTLAVGMR